MEEQIKTGIYIRVSTEEQAKDGFSIHAQREKLTKYAEANDWSVFNYYVDDGISGKNLDGRPEVKRLIEDVEKGRINNILIYKLDRLTRSVRDLIYLIELFEKHHCTFNSQTEKIDTSNAVGRMFVKIIGIFAEFERENLAERVSFGYEQKTREGNYTNTNGVYGYDYVVGEQKLVVNEIEKELVNKIFDLFINGESYFKIAHKLNIQNIPTKRGGHWAASTVKSIITNPLYIGKVRYGLSLKNKERSFTVDGNNIESIVDKEKWMLANNTYKVRKKYGVRRYPSENSYFFHTIKCAKCGGNISPRQQVQRGHLYISYRCNNTSRGLCNCGYFSHLTMERQFIDYLDNLKLIIPSNLIMKKRKLNDNIINKIKKIEDKIIKLNNKKKNIRKQLIDDLITIDEYRTLIKDIEQKQLYLKKEISVLKNGINKNNEPSYTYEDIKDIVGNVKLNWINLTNKEKQIFLERFIDSIYVEKINNVLIIKSVIYREHVI